MKVLILLGLIGWSSFSTFQASADTKGTAATIVDSACQENSKDPNDLGYRFTDNSQLYKGQCVDGSRFRPIKNLVVTSTTATFDNYGHDRKFWKAELPLEKTKIAAVYFHVQRFPVVEGVIAAHTEMRFVFKGKDGVKLTQGSSVQATNDDILISFEAAFPKKVSYNFALGAFPNYARVAKIMSTSQKQSDSTATMEQYELNLSPDEMIDLLKSTLEYSAKIGIEEFYNTLRPNCTTEAFDMIDLLPRFKGKFPPFLTMISPDPIAGPSIEALQKRQLIKQRVQDYADEVKGVQQVLPVPVVKSAMATFLPDVGGRPWTLVTVLPDTSRLSPVEKKTIESLRTELITALPSLIQNYGSVMMLSSADQKGRALFMTTFKTFAQMMPAYLRKINSELPNEAMQIGMYFAPYESAATSTSLVSLGIPAQVPFALNDIQLSDADSKSSQVFYELGQGIDQAGQVGSPAMQKAFLMGANIIVKAQKDNSVVTTQLMAGLGAMESALNVVDPKVTISKIVIPEVRSAHARPAMLVSHVQPVAEKKLRENLDIQFGSFGGLAGTSGEFGFASLQIEKGAANCGRQTRTAPYFQGQLSNQFTGFFPLDFFIQGQPILFHILRVNMNLNTQAVEEMDLSISTLGFACIEDKNTEKQFTENANKAIKDMINNAGNNPLLQKLSPLLN
jgi:hypothetical protein